jgi:hypothetical protein
MRYGPGWHLVRLARFRKIEKDADVCCHLAGTEQLRAAFQLRRWNVNDEVRSSHASRAVRAWNALQEVVRYDRARGGPGVWDGFETLASGTVRYYRKMNSQFPGPYQAVTNATAVPQPLSSHSDLVPPG